MTRMFAALLVFSSSNSAAAPTPELQAAITGDFNLAESYQAIQPRLELSLERAVASLNALFKPIARYKLRPEVRICPSYHVSLDSDTLAYHCGSESDFAVPIVRGRSYTVDGDTYTCKVSISGQTVELSVMGVNGGKVTTFSSMGPDRLRVTNAIVSQHLAEPLAWTVTYARR